MKAPALYQCPCCGSRFLERAGQRCPACNIPLLLEGQDAAEPCYVYEGEKWVWREDGQTKPWQDGWKRMPRPDAKNRDPHWLHKYPGRPTGQM